MYSLRQAMLVDVLVVVNPVFISILVFTLFYSSVAFFFRVRMRMLGFVFLWEAGAAACLGFFSQLAHLSISNALYAVALGLAFLTFLAFHLQKTESSMSDPV